MNADKPASGRTLRSDLRRADAHQPRVGDYEELPELTGAMLKRGVVKLAGQPLATDLRATGATSVPIAGELDHDEH